MGVTLKWGQNFSLQNTESSEDVWWRRLHDSVNVFNVIAPYTSKLVRW